MTLAGQQSRDTGSARAHIELMRNRTATSGIGTSGAFLVRSIRPFR